MVIPSIRWLVAGFSSRRPSFYLRLWYMGFVVEKGGMEAGFLQILLFPLPITIPQTAPYPSRSIVWTGYSRLNSGRYTKLVHCHLAQKL
jgi:hypothetical protein